MHSVVLLQQCEAPEMFCGQERSSDLTWTSCFLFFFVCMYVCFVFFGELFLKTNSISPLRRVLGSRTVLHVLRASTLQIYQNQQLQIFKRMKHLICSNKGKLVMFKLTGSF